MPGRRKRSVKATKEVEVPVYDRFVEGCLILYRDNANDDATPVTGLWSEAVLVYPPFQDENGQVYLTISPTFFDRSFEIDQFVTGYKSVFKEWNLEEATEAKKNFDDYVTSECGGDQTKAVFNEERTFDQELSMADETKDKVKARREFWKNWKLTEEDEDDQVDVKNEVLSKTPVKTNVKRVKKRKVIIESDDSDVEMEYGKKQKKVSTQMPSTSRAVDDGFDERSSSRVSNEALFDSDSDLNLEAVKKKVIPMAASTDRNGNVHKEQPSTSASGKDTVTNANHHLDRTQTPTPGPSRMGTAEADVPVNKKDETEQADDTVGMAPVQVTVARTLGQPLLLNFSNDDVLLQKLSQMEQQMATITNENAALQQTQAQMSSKAAQRDKLLSQMEERISGQQKQLDTQGINTINEKGSVEQQLAQLKQLIDTQQEEINKQKEDMKKIKESSKRDMKKMDDAFTDRLRDERVENMRKNKELKQSVKTAYDQIERLKDELQEAKNEVEGLKGEITELKNASDDSPSPGPSRRLPLKKCREEDHDCSLTVPDDDLFDEDNEEEQNHPFDEVHGREMGLMGVGGDNIEMVEEREGAENWDVEERGSVFVLERDAEQARLASEASKKEEEGVDEREEGAEKEINGNEEMAPGHSGVMLSVVKEERLGWEN